MNFTRPATVYTLSVPIVLIWQLNQLLKICLWWDKPLLLSHFLSCHWSIEIGIRVSGQNTVDSETNTVTLVTHKMSGYQLDYVMHMR
jgi:hypothetical protein